MSATPPDGEDRPDAKPGTLGELLYSVPKSQAREKEWVELVHAIAAGDQRALHALYERAHRLVFTLTMRMTHSRETAEELTVDVFHDVWRRASRFDASGASVLSWLMNQARSRAIDRIRFEQRKKRVNPDPGPSDLVDPASHGDDLLVSKQRERVLRDALTVLSLDERQAIETAFFSELSYAETADRLKEPLGTVKTRIRSGLAKLRQAMSGGAKP